MDRTIGAPVLRSVPRALIVAVFVAGVAIMVTAAFLYPEEGRPEPWLAVLSVLAFPLMIAGVDLENMANARKRAAVYSRLGMALPPSMTRAVRWHVGPMDVLGATVGGYLTIAVIKDYIAVPAFVLTAAFVLLMVVPLAKAWAVVRQRTTGRLKEYGAVAREHGLALLGKGSLQGGAALRGEYGGRPVSLLLRQAQQRLAVKIEEAGAGEGLVLAPAGKMWVAGNKSDLLTTGDERFDERFGLRGTPAKRTRAMFADPTLRETLTGFAELGKLSVNLGGDVLIIDHDYNHPDPSYIQRLLTLGVQLGRRWDGRLFLEAE